MEVSILELKSVQYVKNWQAVKYIKKKKNEGQHVTRVTANCC